jgi:hypothetical protein
MNRSGAAAAEERESPINGSADEDHLGRLRGRRWALVTDDLIGSLGDLRGVETPPSVVLVSPRDYLLTKAEFPAARVGTHPIEVCGRPVELALIWQRGVRPVIRTCLVVDNSIWLRAIEAADATPVTTAQGPARHARILR